MQISKFNKEIAPILFVQLKLLSSQLWDDYWTLEHYELELPEKWNLSYFISEGDVLVGFVIASLKKGAIHINRLVVDERLHRKGYGKKLLNLVEKKCFEYSVCQITLKVHLSNFNSINWYFRNGFSITGKSEDYYEMSKSVL